jgi:hypothetical protein
MQTQTEATSMRRAIQASLNDGFFTPLPSFGSALAERHGIRA